MKRSIVLAALALAGCDFDEVYSPKIHDAKEGVRSRMRDPDSVNFRNVEICKGDRNVVIGDYNAKNGFGAYGGFESFAAEGRYAAFWESSQYDDLLRRCYKGDKNFEEYLRSLPDDIARYREKNPI